jgi:hypothetical protein
VDTATTKTVERAVPCPERPTETRRWRGPEGPEAWRNSGRASDASDSQSLGSSDPTGPAEVVVVMVEGEEDEGKRQE